MLKELFPSRFPPTAEGHELEALLIDEVLKAANYNLEDASARMIEMLDGNNGDFSRFPFFFPETAFFFSFCEKKFFLAKVANAPKPPAYLGHPEIRPVYYDESLPRGPAASAPPPPPRPVPYSAPVRRHKADNHHIPVFWDFLWDSKFVNVSIFDAGK